MEVKTIYENTILFDEGHVRFFLLIGDKKALLIDSGMMCNNALELASSYTDKPIELINTHADRDHISCNNQFEWAYMHPNELMH
ncbi:MAG: MBL fold metallo-hydrolase, partial [Firmicutes bacterium]|nr:MBL fold metallo-hydrolase [Bacillota bacterium]